MFGRLVEEIPRFFTYYTMVFLLDAMGRTLLMTVVGCGLGFAGGFGLVYLRKSTSPFLLPLRVRPPLINRRASALCSICL